MRLSATPCIQRAGESGSASEPRTLVAARGIHIISSACKKKGEDEGEEEIVEGIHIQH